VGREERATGKMSHVKYSGARRSMSPLSLNEILGFKFEYGDSIHLERKW